MPIGNSSSSSNSNNNFNNCCDTKNICCRNREFAFKIASGKTNLIIFRLALSFARFSPPPPHRINVFTRRFIVRRWLRDLCTYGEYRKAFLIVASVWLGVGICSYGIHFSQG